MSDFIGSGWAFPLRLNDTKAADQREPGAAPQKSIALASAEDKIEQAIRIILGTRIGERVMRPTFGSRLHELAFAPVTAETLGLAEMHVADALRFWEPRITLLDVHAALDGEQRDKLCITIRYHLKQTSDERSLVYPFYQIPGDRQSDA